MHADSGIFLAPDRPGVARFERRPPHLGFAAPHQHFPADDRHRVTGARQTLHKTKREKSYFCTGDPHRRDGQAVDRDDGVGATGEQLQLQVPDGADVGEVQVRREPPELVSN